jgi:hypothetical protein
MLKPIFIFSLPRSGSTLLQKILATSHEISTTSEPWLLLPFLHTLKKESGGVFAEYNHNVTKRALGDLLEVVPNGSSIYKKGLHDFVLSIYQAASEDDSRYFLDKTPRYHLICHELINIFPEAKFIFLWRNPLAILASICSYFGNSKWRFHDFKIDLYDGFENLIEVYRDQNLNCFSIRFEDLISKPNEYLPSLFNYLEISFEEKFLTTFQNVPLQGKYGDKSGRKNYSKLSSEPINKWRKQLCNSLRVTWAKRYLYWLGKERLKLIGYDLPYLLEELSSTKIGVNRLGSDLLRLVYGELDCLFEINMLLFKLSHFKKWYKIHSHK